jgi:GNAT superfamily N-acetyltransferase
MLPSFEGVWVNNQRTKPRIQILEIRHRDRPDGDPLAWLLVERQETYHYDDRDNTIYKASISISYQRITAQHSHRDGGHGRFDGSYSKLSNSISLTSTTTSKGAIFLDLPGLDGQRIGTYLLNEIVRWVQRWPEANVNSVELLDGQAHGNNKERRNKFYEQFGLVFDYTDSERREGHSRPMQVAGLTPVETWKQNIIERQMFDYLAGVLYAEQRALSELTHRNRACESLISERKNAESKPIRWALKMLYYQYGGILAGGAAIALLLAMVWSNL